jgi:NAD(P)-dependent dehydrogenase (short-subunit alcohol dehydrogenase family)
VTGAREVREVREARDEARVAVVTGAGRGIGRATALALAERGYDVALLARTEAQLEETAARIAERGRRALAVRCDVSRGGEVQRAAARVLEELGAPRVVVNNAGIVRRARVEETSEEAWDEVLDVNLKGTFLVSRALLPAMLRAGRGRVVCVSSISGTLGTARQAAYCAAKWGVIGFTKSLAEELRGTGLCAMCVMPGSVDTQMLAGSGFAPQMGPDDVAKVIVYAALDAPGAMNGSAIEAFGGG